MQCAVLENQSYRLDIKSCFLKSKNPRRPSAHALPGWFNKNLVICDAVYQICRFIPQATLSTVFLSGFSDPHLLHKHQQQVHRCTQKYVYIYIYIAHTSLCMYIHIYTCRSLFLFAFFSSSCAYVLFGTSPRGRLPGPGTELHRLPRAGLPGSRSFWPS